MDERHQCVFTLFVEGHCDCRLDSQGVGGNPGVVNAVWAGDLDESAVVGRALEGPEEQAVYFWAEDEFEGVNQLVE